MAVCTWCVGEMTTVHSCTVDALHRNGKRVSMIPYGREHGRSSAPAPCGDCGVARGRWHHPGCDLQACPTCFGQMLSCGCRFDEDRDDGEFDDEDEDDDDAPWGLDSVPLGVDGNGVLTELMLVDGMEVIVHREVVPDSDITTVRGIRCTTALRTLIDIAPEVEPNEFAEMFDDFFDRRLFTADEAHRRLDQPDMVDRRGAHLLRARLPPRE